MPLKAACNVPGCQFIRELFGGSPLEPEEGGTSTCAPTREREFIEETRNYKFTSRGLREIKKKDTTSKDNSRHGMHSQPSVRADPGRADNRFWELPGNQPSSQFNAEEVTVQRTYESSPIGSLNAMVMRNESASSSLHVQSVSSRSQNLIAESFTSKFQDNSNGAAAAMPSVARRPSIDNVLNPKTDALNAGTHSSAIQTNDGEAVVAMPTAASMPSADDVLHARTDSLKTGQPHQTGLMTPPGGPPLVRSPPVTQALPNQQHLISMYQSQQDAMRPVAQSEPPVLQSHEAQQPQLSPIPIQFPQKSQQKAPFAPNPIQQTSTLAGVASATQQQQSSLPSAYPQGTLDAVYSSPNISSTTVSPTRTIGDNMVVHRASGAPRVSHTSPRSSAATDLSFSSGRLSAAHNQFPLPNNGVTRTSQAHLKVDEATKQAYATTGESIDSATSLATLDDRRNRLAPLAYFNDVDVTSQQGSITTSAAVDDAMTEVGLMVPPLCPALILPQSESRFGMSLSALASAGSNATLSVVSLSGKVLMTMRICEQNKLEMYLAMHADRPRCTVLVPTGEEAAFNILDSIGRLYGKFMCTAANVHEVVAQSQRVLLVQGTCKTMKFSVTAPSGEPVAMARRNATDYQGGEHFEIRTLPGADTFLVTACLFAILLFTSPE